MNGKVARIVLVVASILAVTAGAGWYQEIGQARALRIHMLEPIAALLKEDQQLLQALESDSALEKDAGILASYLSKIRADGVAKHSDMKQRLDQLAENNSAIVAHVNVYLNHAKTAAFTVEAEKFRHYAIAWRDRWNSVMELFMAGGNYPVTEVPFPKTYLSAVQAEVEAVQRVF